MSIPKSRIRIQIAVGVLGLTFATAAIAELVSKEQLIDRLQPTKGFVVEDVSVSHPPVALDIQFELNSSLLSAAAIPQLEELAAAMTSMALQNARFAIVGHTDGSGSAAYNLKLSYLRAQSVRDYLAQQGGVELERLLAEGRGEEEPLPGKPTTDPSNRRVEIVLLGNRSGDL